MEASKVNIHHRRIKQLVDLSDLVAVCFPGNRNQQHAAACILFELKWATERIVPDLAALRDTYHITPRILQRTRAKLSRLGLIEHISYLNVRYNGRSGWKLSGRFATALRSLAQWSCELKERTPGSREKELLLIDLLNARRASFERKV